MPDVGQAASSSANAARRVRKRPARPDYVRPRRPDGASVDTDSFAGQAVKCSAVTALLVFLDQIANSRAYDTALVSIDVDMSAATYRHYFDLPFDNAWSWFDIFLLYVLLLHVVILWFLGGRVRARVRAYFRIEYRDAASQCMLLPDTHTLTVEGLRHELRAQGMRATGLRVDLERRWAAFAAAAEQQ